MSPKEAKWLMLRGSALIVREEIKKIEGEPMKLKRLIFLIFGIPLPGTGLRRRGAAHPAYSALFPGDGVLLCQFVPKTPRLVCEH